MDGVENDGGGVGPGFLPQELRLQALGPDLKLLAGGGAEGVGGAKQHAAALLLPAVGQLGDGGGFAGAVDPDQEDHVRLAVRSLLHRDRRLGEGSGGAEQRGQFLPQGLAKRGGIGEVTALDPLAQALEDFRGGFHPQVGAQQGGFELGENRRVDLLASEEDFVHPLGELLPGAADRLLEAAPPVALLLGFGVCHGCAQCLF